MLSRKKRRLIVTRPVDSHSDSEVDEPDVEQNATESNVSSASTGIIPAVEESSNSSVVQDTAFEGAEITDAEASVSGENQNPKKSVILQKYFQYGNEGKEDKKGTCLLCKRNGKNVVMKMKYGNTSALHRHLLRFHPNEHKIVHPEKLQVNRKVEVQSPLDKFLRKGITKKPDQQFNQDVFNKMTVDWMAVKYLPFSFFEDDQTVKYFEYLNESAVLFKGDAMRNRALARFDEIKKEVMMSLQGNNSKLSFTVDGWTSIATKCFYGITAHYIDNNWALQSLVVDFVPSRGGHSGEDIARIFNVVLTEYNIANKVQALTLDNAAVNSTFMEHLGAMLPNFDVKDNHFRCFAHIINLAAQSVMKLLRGDSEEHETGEYDDDECVENDEENKSSLAKIRSIFVKIRRSEQWANKYRSCCESTNVKTLSPPLDVSTRWNSSFEMLSTALKVRPALDALCTNNNDLKNFKLSNSEWAVISKVSVYLGNFKVFSTHLGGDKYVTLPSVVPRFNLLIDNIEKNVLRLNNLPNRSTIDENILLAFQAGRDKMLSYYNKLNWIYCIVLFLDPRHNKETFSKTSWGQEMLHQSLMKFEDIFRSQYYADIPEVTNRMQEEVDVLQSTQSSEDIVDFDCLYEEGPQNYQHEGNWRVELEKYYKEKRVPKDSDILLWWRLHEPVYPNLAKMAKDFLAIPATSVPAERLFSKAGLTITKKRNRLNADSARCMLCLNSWLMSGY